MDGISRRFFFLCIGAAAVFSSPRRASASFVADDTPENRDFCKALDGTDKPRDDDGEFWCEGTRRDRQCRTDRGADFYYDPMVRPDGTPVPASDFIGDTSYDPKRCSDDLGCFLTTACREEMQLADDCFELRALRRFRDGIMIRTAAGRRDIRRYYAVAPRILERLARRGTTRRELARAYVLFILPAAFAAQLGFVRLTERLYRAMLASVMRRARPARAEAKGMPLHLSRVPR
ncbi:MAG: CFI-box-CTERM domain-containing protein [Pseudomonadota bacterium]